MTRLIARLILAMLLLPLSGTVFVLMMGTLFGRAAPPSGPMLAVVWAVVYAFIGTYWVLLWRELVNWTPHRKRQTVLSVPAALLAGAVIGVCLGSVMGAPLTGAMLVGGGIPPIVWVLATVLIWRETPQERIERLAAAGTDSVCCPVCGYNMTGLHESRCPECGSQFTLDELLSAQPDRDRAVLHEE